MTESKEKIEFKSFLDHIKDVEDHVLLEKTLALNGVISFYECFRDVDTIKILEKKHDLETMKHEIMKRMYVRKCHHSDIF